MQSDVRSRSHIRSRGGSLPYALHICTIFSLLLGDILDLHLGFWILVYSETLHSAIYFKTFQNADLRTLYKNKCIDIDISALCL